MPAIFENKPSNACQANENLTIADKKN